MDNLHIKKYKEYCMANKSLLKFVVAFGLLAILLIFLGVNYVPRISASSSSTNNTVDAMNQAGSDYINQYYPRAILPQGYSTGSDWLNHHPYEITSSLDYTGSDWIERHSSNYYTNSDWIERQR